MNPPRETWLTPFSNAWAAQRGIPPFGRLAVGLRPLIETRGSSQVLAAWLGYLEDRRGKAFCNVQDFSANYEVYRAKWAVLIHEDGSERPMPDEPITA